MPTAFNSRGGSRPLLILGADADRFGARRGFPGLGAANRGLSRRPPESCPDGMDPIAILERSMEAFLESHGPTPAVGTPESWLISGGSWDLRTRISSIFISIYIFIFIFNTHSDRTQIVDYGLFIQNEFRPSFEDRLQIVCWDENKRLS